MSPCMHSHAKPNFFHLGLFVCGCCLLILLGACSNNAASRPTPPLPHSMPVDPPPGADVLTANTYAGDAISTMLLQRVTADSGILVTSLVNLEDLNESSPFGRVTTQQIASRIAQHGFLVLEVRLTDAMRMDIRQGEFMLSRDTTRILAKEHNAHAVLVGTWSRGAGKIFVSIRAVRLDDAAVIAAYEYYLPLQGDTSTLMLGNAGGSGSGLWNKYAARGQAFPHKTSQSPAAEAPTSANKEEAQSASTGAPTPSSGKPIDPTAPPAPLRKK